MPFMIRNAFAIINKNRKENSVIFQFIKRLLSSTKNSSSAPTNKSSEPLMQYRHGDVMLELIDQLPAGSKRKLTHATLAFGEITGHSHAIRQKSDVTLYDYGTFMCLDVHAKTVSLVHEEHATIELPKGLYRVWRQREYSPEEIRIIQD